MERSDLLRLILTSRVYDVAVETPLEPAPRLSRRLGNDVVLKREDLQRVFSFKLRGAYNRMAHLTGPERERGVVTASAGNHAQGVAYAARHLGITATIVMPLTTPEIKVQAVRDMAATVELAGDTYSDAKLRADQIAAETGRIFVHPFDDPLVIAGQGTIATEVLRHRLGDVSAIFVPVGGGGLIAGIGGYVKAIRPDVKVIGVEPFEADAMYRSLEAGARVALEHVGIFADGVAVREVGELTFDLARGTVDEVVRVSNDEICAAIKDVFDDTRSILEPAGALGVAGLVTMGGPDRYQRRAARGGAERRQHEFRPAAFRRRAGRHGRRARGAVRRHHSRTPGRIPGVLRRDRPPRGHRVQLSAQRSSVRAHLRRDRDRLEGRCPSSSTTRWPEADTRRWT